MLVTRVPLYDLVGVMGGMGGILRNCQINCVETLYHSLVHTRPPGLTYTQYSPIVSGENRREKIEKTQRTITGVSRSTDRTELCIKIYFYNASPLSTLQSSL